MTKTNCDYCQYASTSFYTGEVTCAVNPVHAAVWTATRNLDDYTKNYIQVDNSSLYECHSFKSKINLVKEKDLELLLTPSSHHRLNTEKFSQMTKFIKTTVLCGTGILAFIVSSVYAYQTTSDLPLYRNNAFPYTLSNRARAAVPRCTAIFDSLQKEIDYEKRSRELSQLNSCLNDTPLGSVYKNRILELESYFEQAVYQPGSLDTNTKLYIFS